MSCCPKCQNELEFRTIVEDSEDKKLKKLCYCANCDEHQFIIEEK